MNILVSALSLYKPAAPAEYVLRRDSREYRITACQTNEPVPMALAAYLQRQGANLDALVLLCTPATLIPDAQGMNSVERLTAALSDAQLHPQIHTLRLQEMAESQAIYGASLELLELCRQFDSPELYIDSTGGFRDSMMFLLSMMQLLKGENFRIADVLYTVYDRNISAPYPIVSRMDSYKVYDLISGYEALNTYGDPRKLKEYFADKPISDQARNILNALQSVYQEMQLCRVVQSNSALLRLTGLLDSYTPGDSAFDRVVELAQKKYGGIRDGITYPDYIKWYFSHGYIPQTLAFFYETLPDLLVDRGILYPSTRLTRCLKHFPSNVPTRTANYHFLNAHPRRVRAAIARAEVLELAHAGNIPMEELGLSEAGCRLYTALNYARLARLDSRLLEKPEVKYLQGALEQGQVHKLSSLSDLWRFDSNFAVYEEMARHDRLLRALYGVEYDEPSLPEQEHTQRILESVDGLNIFLGEGVDREKLTALLEKYFYLKTQRNSILHIGQDSASHKTLLKNIREAIELMDEVIGK